VVDADGLTWLEVGPSIGIEPLRLELHEELITKKLVDPIVLGNHGQSLI
jgi:hypothetical protein